MTKLDVIIKLINLPLDYSTKSKSVRDLIRDSGYCKMHNLINEQDIEEVLNEHPDKIQEWMGYCEDRRSSGWFFTQNSEDVYTVYYYPSSVEKRERIFRQRYAACAYLIKNEAEDISKKIR